LVDVDEPDVLDFARLAVAERERLAPSATVAVCDPGRA
jgi:hypothetical protein